MSLSVNVSAQESVMVPLARIPTDEADGKVVNSMRSSASAAKPQIEKRRVRRPGLDDAGRVRVLPDERTRAHLENAKPKSIESINFSGGVSVCRLSQRPSCRDKIFESYGLRALGVATGVIVTMT
jgi:hypothetical protein